MNRYKRDSTLGGIYNIAPRSAVPWSPKVGDIIEYHQPEWFGGGMVRVEVIRLNLAGARVRMPDGREVSACGKFLRCAKTD